MKIYKIFFILIILVAHFSCAKEETVFLNGDMAGLVKLTILPSYTMPDDMSGVAVTIENTSYTTLTNEIGRYDFKEIPAGTYNIIFEKEGYDTKKISGLRFMGGNVTLFLGEMLLFMDSPTEEQ